MIRAILARSTDRIIGTTGKDGPCLPWRLPPDLKHFRKLTTGHTIIMGRTTFDSIGKPLPNRHNIVVSSRPPSEWGGEIGPADSFEWAGNPDEALEMSLARDKSPFVIGGASIYQALWPRIDMVHLTTVHTNVGLGLVFEWDPMQWTEGTDEEGEYEGLRYEFSTLVRRRTVQPSSQPQEKK